MADHTLLPDFFRPGEMEKVRYGTLDEKRDTWLSIVPEIPARMKPFYDLDWFVLTDQRLDPRKALVRAFELISPIVSMQNYPGVEDPDLSLETFNACEYVCFYTMELLRKFEPNLVYGFWEDPEMPNDECVVIYDRRNPGRSQYDAHSMAWFTCGDIVRMRNKGPLVFPNQELTDRIWRVFNIKLESLTKIIWSQNQQRFIRTGEIPPGA